MDSPNFQCDLCQEEVVIPVKILAFTGCRQEPGGPTCNSVKRYCLVCVRNFLFLNQFPPESRPNTVKCPICRTSKCNPRVLNAKTAYDKDYMLMSLMTRQDYPCPRTDQGCEFKGSQNDVDRHLKDSCQFRITKCDCSAMIRPCDIPEHMKQCPLYTPCEVCQELHPRIKMGSHLHDVHNKVKCARCFQLVDNDKTDHHAQEICPERCVTCEVCLDDIPHKTMRDHLMYHTAKASQDIQTLVQQLQASNDYLRVSAQAVERFSTGKLKSGKFAEASQQAYVGGGGGGGGGGNEFSCNWYIDRQGRL